MDSNIERKQRKQRSDKGVARGCRWTSSYHSLHFRLSDDLYQQAMEKKGNKSINQFLNDVIREAIGRA